MPKSQKFTFICVHLWVISCFFLLPISVRPQVRPIYDYGANGLGQLLKKLNTTKSVMMIGAHPDDEDSALLAYLARGENARTAYLSLTRGDGGQNIIGSELFESLGVIRTEELLQARRLDGAEQFFTRAFDFGFTKTLAETKQKWDEKVILCDTVRAIRTFRPLVVISRFSGTPADGHGQHQYSGYISPLAVKAAADPAQCKDSGVTWQVLKFYVEQGFRGESPAALQINTGKYDALLGRSYAEIAAEGRSQHKTQEQGGLELKGDRFSGLNLIESKAVKVEKETSIFDGIDTSISAIPKNAGFKEEFRKDTFAEAEELAQKALQDYEAENPQKLISTLVKGLQSVQRIRGAVFCTEAGTTNSGFGNCDKFTYQQKLAAEQTFALIYYKQMEFNEAIIRASGIRIEAISDRETISPDEKFSFAVKAFIPKSANAKVQGIYIENPSNWSFEEINAPQETGQNFRNEKADVTATFTGSVNSVKNYNVYTQPYWLKKPRSGALFNWGETNYDENYYIENLPFAPPIVKASVNIEIGGTVIAASKPVEYRYADGVRGELRRELNVVPKVSVKLNQDLLVVPSDNQLQTRKIVVNIQNNSSSPFNGSADLKLPEGWKIKQSFGIVQLDKKDESKSFEFDVTIPANAKVGNYEIQASVKSGEESYSQTMHTIAYPHIQTHRFYTDAQVKVAVINLKAAPVKVGYIMGSGDDVPDAIRQMGIAVDLLTEKDLAGGDLAKYDVIVAGIRGYQVRGDLIANNRKVLDYVNDGGTLIVQYQRPDYAANNLAPFPASMNDTQKTTAGTTARVVDENAKVTILQPNSPIFNLPNKITDADFGGWVQERNLYNFTTFDDKYTPLLESHDAGELENKGGMVYAKIGKGNYVYTSYSFFRQLPAGVPGAYRLFANLLSLPRMQK